MPNVWAMILGQAVSYGLRISNQLGFWCSLRMFAIHRIEITTARGDENDNV